MSKRHIGKLSKKFADKAEGNQIKNLNGKSMVSLFCRMLLQFVNMSVIRLVGLNFLLSNRRQSTQSVLI